MKKYFSGIVLITILLLQGCNMIQLESMWKDREITIDGNDKDWIDAQYYLKDYNVVLGVMNDADFVYLCFYPTTQELTRQLITQGCTLWINTEGKKKKDVGIHFPLGMQSPQMFDINDKIEQQMPTERNNKMGISNIEKMLLTLPKEVEIIGPARDNVKKIKLKELVGLEMSINAHKGLFAYELKIPLKENAENSLSLGIEPGKEIVIGLETPRILRKKTPSDLGGPESGMKGGGLSGRSGSGMRDMPENELEKMGQSPKSLNAWMTVLLVSK